MHFSRLRSLYDGSPQILKNLVLLFPFSLIAGRSYREPLRQRVFFDGATRTEILRWQEEALGKMLSFATDQVPAYRPLRSVVERLSSFEALKAFPLLDKDTVQANPQDYLARDIEKIPHYLTTTGGTTGSQLSIYLDDNSQQLDIGFMHRQWLRVGFKPRHKKATFRGVPFRQLKSGTYWQHNPIYNELQFSPFHMTEDNLGGYVEQLIRYSPSCLHGYPSAIDVLAEYVLRHDLGPRLPRMIAAFLASEGATAAQRERISRAFNTRVYTWYGHSERVILAGECEQSSDYHQFPDYGILELVDDEGHVCDREGERGELVGTGLLSCCMPLIRYRTGDYATRLDPNCACGRCWDRFTNVEGHRKQEMIVGKHGAKMSLAALNMHGPLFERVIRYQYYQEVEGVCILKVVGSPAFSERDRCAIESAYKDKVGDEVAFSVQLVKEIPLTYRGKTRLVDSRIQANAQD